nr:cyclic nucleotide-binding domain-containing protein [Anaerolineae bacterium]
MSAFSLLKQISLFELLSDAQLASLVEAGSQRQFAAGQTIFNEHDPPDGMYVLLSGQVRVYLQDQEGCRVELNRLKPGDYFGEMALIDSSPRSASVAAISPCDCLIIDEHTFQDMLLNSQANTSYHILRLLTAKVRDNSYRILEEEALRHRMEIEQHRALSRIVVGVAHELNTPLGLMNTAAGVIAARLKADTLKPAMADPELTSIFDDILQAADILSGNARRASELVKAFKDVSASQVGGKLESVPLVKVVNDCVRLFEIQARQAGIAIQVKNHLAPPEAVWEGYPGALSQVLTNLLTNVERYAYTPETGGLVTIVLAASQRNDQPAYIITFRDYGKGILPDDLPHIFDPFFTTGRDQGGSGLGLTTVFNLVTVTLQGQIAVESPPGGGVAFTIAIPQTIASQDRRTGRANVL